MTQPPEFAEMLRPGALFAGDFELERKLGEGGMGAVYVALQRSTGVRRALKVMGATVLQNPRAWERFEQEARLSARIRSDHVVKVITAGIEPTLQIPYLVMELLEGQTLDGVLRSGPVEASEAGVLLGQLCHGLAEMHRLGIVHRDIKPENIFIASANRADIPFTVKLLDFGIAKELSGIASSGVTQAVGTPKTMAPEQADPRHSITPATDVWALGLVAFHLLTGRDYWLAANHAGGTLQGLLAEVMNLPLPPPSERAEQLGCREPPDGFDGWFSRCIRRDPADRFRDASEAWAALAPLLGAPASSGGPRVSSRPLSAGLPSSSRAPSLGNLAALPFAETAPPPSATAIAATAPAPGVQTGAPAGGAAAAPAGRRRAGLALLGALVAGLGAVGWWGRPRVERCQELLLLQDDVQCLGALTAEQAARRGESFHVERSAGKARRATRQSGAGAALPDEDGVAGLEFEYEGKRLAVIRSRGARGEVVLTQVQKGPGRYEARGPGGEPALYPGGRHGVVEVEYDEAGRPRRQRYLARSGQPASDRSGAFGHEYRRDSRGREVERVVLGADGKPSVDGDWVQRRERQYSAQGWLQEERVFGPEGPSRPRGGCARERYTSDEVGNVVRVTCHDGEGRAAAYPDGYQGWQARYDGRGGRIEVRKEGPGGATAPDRRGVAIEQIRRDERGRAVEIRLLAPDGSPTQDDRGVAGQRVRYDERGDEIERVFLDTSGQPSNGAEGHAMQRLRRDAQGRVVERSFFDPEGKPTYGQEGYAAVRFVYDGRGREVERTYLDDEGKPTLCGDRYATLRSAYDEQGRLTEERFFGLGGEPTRTGGWYAVRLHRHDEAGNEVETAWLGPDGKPTRTRDGHSSERRKFNDRGQEVEVVYLGPGGSPTFNNRGSAGRRTKHDALGREVERSNLDVAGRVAPDDEGKVQERLVLDDRGNEVERAYFDALGLPMVSRVEGYARRKARLDARGQVEEYAYLDGRGEPTPGPAQAAVERYRYDERGHAVEMALLDAQGKPVADRDGVSIFRWKVNARGEKVEWAHLDVEGKPTRGKDGYAVARTTPDSKGRQSEWVYLDAEGHPARYRGHARSQARYDAKGRKVESSYQDETGAPTNLEGKGAPVIRLGYDERGNQTFEALELAGGGVPSLAVVRREFRYNDRDLLVEARPLGADGRPPADHLLVRTEYDDRGQRVELAYHDAGGERAEAATGVSVERLVRDERGLVIERSFFDRALRPVMHRELKAARMRYTHDDAGRKRGEDCYDEAGKLLRTNRFGEQQDEPKKGSAHP